MTVSPIENPPNNDDAARFAGYLQPALKTISHWDTDDFDMGESPHWAEHPGITVIARDEKDFTDPTKPAARLKSAIESKGIKVPTEPVPTLNKADDVGLWVNTCK